VVNGPARHERGADSGGRSGRRSAWPGHCASAAPADDPSGVRCGQASSGANDEEGVDGGHGRSGDSASDAPAWAGREERESLGEGRGWKRGPVSRFYRGRVEGKGRRGGRWSSDHQGHQWHRLLGEVVGERGERRGRDGYRR
jgi:hypothetical protein